jgi:uncharacterized protein (TIGR03437 family)
VAIDGAGNLFIADYGNHRVRKVSSKGIITTIAGTEIAGFSGDGGPATSAQLSSPAGVAVDFMGNLFIADAVTGVRKVSANGMITTVAGGGVSVALGDGGPATAAGINSPFGVAVDFMGNFFIADTGNNRIRKVSASGIITTVAGTGSRGDSGDGGPAIAAQLDGPLGVAVDFMGNVFVADTANNRIRKVSASGIITTVAGTGKFGFSGDGSMATAALLAPFGVAVDFFGNLYVTDTGNLRIRKVSDGIITTIAGTGRQGFSGDGGPAIGGDLTDPVGISLDAQGNVFFSERNLNRIRRLALSPLATDCQYALDQNQQAFTAIGGSASVGILANAATCPWFSASSANWITIGGSAVGNGTGLLAYSVAPNPNSASRTGMLLVAGSLITVTQSGLTCSVNVPTRNLSVAAAGITGATMAVSFNAPDCSWNATASVPWILLASPSNGTGNGIIAYTVGVNAVGLRTGAIVISGRTVYINQAGAGGSTASLASIANGGVVNGASYAPLTAPGSFVAIYGQTLADTAASWDSAITDGKTLPTSLGGVQVQINGKKAFVYYVSPGQINVLTPPDSTTGFVDIDVTTNHGTAAASVNMGAVSPAFFAYTLQGKLYPVAYFANENVQVAADGAVAGAASRPATVGDYIVLYATGLGQTTPAYPAGQVLSAAYPITDLSQVQVIFGARPAKVLFAGMTYAGVFQVNVQVPDGIATGEASVVLRIGDQSSAQATVLPFRQ